jgi:hypothetical protein
MARSQELSSQAIPKRLRQKPARMSHKRTFACLFNVKEASSTRNGTTEKKKKKTQLDMPPRAAQGRVASTIVKSEE